MPDRYEDACPSCGAQGNQECGTPSGRDHLSRRRLTVRLMERDEFNRRHPIGTPVRFWPGAREGVGRVSRTRTSAWLMSSAVVVSVDDYAGGIALSHIEVSTHSDDPCPVCSGVLVHMLDCPNRLVTHQPSDL